MLNNKCDIVISTDNGKITLSGIVDKGDNSYLQAVVSYLRQNPEYIDKIINNTDGFYTKSQARNHPIGNTSIEQITNNIPVEGGWPRGLEALESFKDSKVLYIESRGVRPFTIDPIYGTLIVYSNGIYQFRDYLITQQVINKIDTSQLSDKFRKVFEEAKKLKKDLTEKQLLLDYLENTEDYIEELGTKRINKNEDPLDILREELEKFTNDRRKIKYRSNFLNAINARLKEDAIGRLYINAETLVSLIEDANLKNEILNNLYSNDEKIIESAINKIKTYIKQHIDTLDPEFQYAFSEMYMREDSSPIIYFKKVVKTVQEVQQLKKGTVFKFEEPYKGYRIYSLGEGENKRYFFSRTILTSNTKVDPYTNIEHIHNIIDNQIQNIKLNDAKTETDLAAQEIEDTGINVSYKFIQNDKSKVGTIIKVLDQQTNAYIPKVFYWNTFLNRPLKDFTNKLLQLRKTLQAKQELITKFYGENVEQFAADVTEIQNNKDASQAEALAQLLERFGLDAEGNLIPKFKEIFAKNSIKYVDADSNINLLEAATSLLNIQDSKQFNSILNYLFTEEGFYTLKEINKALEILNTPEKAKAFIQRFCTEYNGKPISNLSKDVLEPIEAAKYTYYQLAQAEFSDRYYVSIKDPNVELWKDFKDAKGKEYKFSVPKADALNAIVEALSKKLAGTGFNIELRTAEEIAKEGTTEAKYRASQKGYLSGNTIVINKNYADLTTPLHEYIHVFLGIVKAMKGEEAYINIISAFMNTQKSSNIEFQINQAKKLYPSLSYYDLMEEVFANMYADYIVQYKIEDAFKNPAINLEQDLNQIFDQKPTRLAMKDLWQLPLFKLNELMVDVASAEVARVEEKELKERMKSRRQATNWIKDSLKNKLLTEKCE